ncbi:non-canonical purine NTP pyrophosphatase [Alphaproteobacteria bacterium]|nr:non-canonical purine NTP pyrophosphatase [Alphaproteobacteria bacterium]
MDNSSYSSESPASAQSMASKGMLERVSKIVIASTNRGKITEIQNMDFFKNFEILTAANVNLGNIEENGDTLEENALLKARYCYNQTRLPSLADDTGFFINALGGFPGIHCGRLAGASGNRNFNVAAKIISDKLGDAEDRSCLFATAVAFVIDGIEFVSRGEMHGKFVYPGRPDNKFDELGYKNYFIPDGIDITCAQADPEDESFFKHRATAVRNLIAQINGQEEAI